MTIAVRKATEDDLAPIAALTAGARRQRAEWEPEYFRVADGADDAHERYLRELLSGGDGVVPRVVTSDDEVVGCAFSVRQDHQWVVDDVASADEGWWSDGMQKLLRAVDERPALLCVPRSDIRQTGCADALGMRLRSSFWRLGLDGAVPPSGADVAETDAADLRPAPHQPLVVRPDDDGVTVLGEPSGGRAVLASPMPVVAPVYDPGGTTGLVDRVTGGRRGDLVDAAAHAAASRGDVQLVVVCAEDDPVLQDALIERAFHRVVDVYSWPDSFWA
ncbi:MAG: hypothetical protein J2P24_06870 [Streptosporangiales bacterium]|nr:hypothetical protein [Streptosporangiales bacterium]MBO0889439.1 hypothetical protein [Acidothermales bacterium]